MKKIIKHFTSQLLLIFLLCCLNLAMLAMEETAENRFTCQESTTSWDNLPTEIKLQIISFLQTQTKTIKEFVDFALVNSDFASAINACPLSTIKTYVILPGTKITLIDIFFEAVNRGNYNITKILIERGIDVNQRDCFIYANTALIIAAGKGHTDIAELLIKNGAVIEARNQVFDATALLKASNNDHLDTLKLLIAKGADINARNSNGETALMFASKFGYTQMAKFLIEHGANAVARDNHHHTALTLATRNKYLEIVELLTDHLAHQ